MVIIMAKIMKNISVVTILITISFCILYRITDYRVLISFIITFGTIAYHFVIRLTVGLVVDMIMHNRADYHKKWYQVSEFEMKLYQKLKVKKWKTKMPTYNADIFDVSKHSWDEIVQATCQSEIVHEINAVFSLIPIISSIWFGAFWIFLITSVAGAVFDLMFVFMQRFNRTRILKISSSVRNKMCRND